MVIILCPKKANTSFKKELEGKIKQPYSIFSTEEVSDVEGSRYYIFNHRSMHKYGKKIVDLCGEYKVIAIIDEAHILQDDSSNQSKFLSLLRPRFNAVWGLTATPLLNNPEGLYHVTNFIRPMFFGTYKTFEKTYLKTKRMKMRRGKRLVKFNKILGVKNVDKLSQKLKYISHVRKKDYDIDFIYRKVQADTNIMEDYQKAGRGLFTEEFGARLHDLQSSVSNVLYESLSERLNRLESKFGRLDDVEDRIVLRDRINQIEEGLLEVNERVSISNKEKLLLKTLKEIIDRNEGTLIYVEYIPTEHRLVSLLEKYKDKLGYNKLYRITGSIDYSERIKVEKELDRKDIVIINEAGKESINLRQVNNIVFYELPFAIGTFIQIVGRITRLDTEYDSQLIYVLETVETIDTYKRMLIQDNAKLIKDLFGSNSNLPKSLNKIDKKFMKKLKKDLLWKFNN